jgi:hypothetical protein
MAVVLRAQGFTLAHVGDILPRPSTLKPAIDRDT